jgi:adenylate kinase
MIDTVIEIFVPDEKITERMSGRRVCESCGASYHIVYKMPKNGRTCDLDGGKLIQRADDKPETVLARLNVYHEQTEPLKAYYARQNKLSVVEGQEEVSKTTALTLNALKG